MFQSHYRYLPRKEVDLSLIFLALGIQLLKLESGDPVSTAILIFRTILHFFLDRVGLTVPERS